MRKSIAAAVLALAVVAPAAPSAYAAPSASCATNHSISAKAYAKAVKRADKEGKKLKKVKDSVVNQGRVSSKTADTLTFTVRGGPCPRNAEMTVRVTETTKIRLDGALTTLDKIEKGDHVNVKGKKVSLVGVGTIYTATRIAAASPKVAPAP